MERSVCHRNWLTGQESHWLREGRKHSQHWVGVEIMNEPTDRQTFGFIVDIIITPFFIRSSLSSFSWLTRAAKDAVHYSLMATCTEAWNLFWTIKTPIFLITLIEVRTRFLLLTWMARQQQTKLPLPQHRHIISIIVVLTLNGAVCWLLTEQRARKSRDIKKAGKVLIKDRPVIFTWTMDGRQCQFFAITGTGVFIAAIMIIVIKGRRTVGRVIFHYSL